MPPIINPDGLFRGRRLRRLSDAARLHWPYYFLGSNGWGRLELDYEVITATLFLGFDAPPTEADFQGFFDEYRRTGLIFIYEAGAATWGQWDCPDKYLPRHKTRQDRDSPAPPTESYNDWLRFRQDTDSEAFQKLLENFRKFPRVVVGVGVVVDVGEEDTHTPSRIRMDGTGNGYALADYDPTELVTWLRERWPRHRQAPPDWVNAIAETVRDSDADGRLRKSAANYLASDEVKRGAVMNLGKFLPQASNWFDARPQKDYLQRVADGEIDLKGNPLEASRG